MIESIVGYGVSKCCATKLRRNFSQVNLNEFYKTYVYTQIHIKREFCSNFCFMSGVQRIFRLYFFCFEFDMVSDGSTSSPVRPTC